MALSEKKVEQAKRIQKFVPIMAGSRQANGQCADRLSDSNIETIYRT